MVARLAPCIAISSAKAKTSMILLSQQWWIRYSKGSLLTTISFYQKINNNKLTTETVSRDVAGAAKHRISILVSVEQKCYVLPNPEVGI
jgi:hypothetical protein